MGCYPLFNCERWDRLDDDLRQLENKLVAVSLVTDPFGEFHPAELARCFPDVCRPFKEHHVVELSENWETKICRHHRRRVRGALSALHVERAQNPDDWLDDWCELYSQLIDHHQIQGIARFSRESFARQLRTPGIVAFRALQQGTNVGMLLWYVHGPAAYYHLGAFSPAGYSLGASYALFREALAYFATTGIRWAELGAGAGLDQHAEDGLTRFKQGWAGETRTAWFCGRVLDRAQYRKLAEDSGTAKSKYFPAYRQPETGSVDLPRRTQTDTEEDGAGRVEGERWKRIDSGAAEQIPHGKTNLPISLRSPRSLR
jgi:hypothetical protein